MTYKRVLASVQLFPVVTDTCTCTVSERKYIRKPKLESENNNHQNNRQTTTIYLLKKETTSYASFSATSSDFNWP